ncbi:MAG TPA: serine/threonine-protein kinase [Kofleriaceae bacterium]|nr:serine/threonine-protein kinase [Kofleriaceae bacterium]
MDEGSRDPVGPTAPGAAFDATTPGERPSSGSLAVSLTDRQVGDYIFGRVIGSGGMGVIYEATDRKLHRKVAIKVIREQQTEDMTGYASNRLLREAQSMARLQHPNVVTIYQVGTIDSQVFVAMEFIDGQTLTQWLETTNPTWRKALEVMLQAGHGLEAAHRAGIVHRDFKPDNILIGRDGRVLVTDFGIARAAHLHDLQAPTQSGFRRDANLTMTGAIMGTPRYMSPEQHEGRSADARSDQYSYCITLFEALYRKRPFECESWEELIEAKDACKIAAPPAGTPVPRALRGIITRGLDPKPAERYPAMRDVLTLIESQRTRRRWYAVAGVAGVSAVAAAAVGGVMMSRSGATTTVSCTTGSARLAESWNPARKQAIEKVFRSVKRPFDEPSWLHTTATLDSYAQAWANMYKDACEATHVRHEQSERLLDRRMSCLRRRADELETVLGLFDRADATIASQSADAVSRLSRVEDCAPTEAMSIAAAENLGPEQRAERDKLSGQLARAKSLASIGKVQQGIELAQPVADTAKAKGLRAIEAEALVLLGRLHASAGRFQNAKDVFVRASEVAERAREVALRAEALIELVYIDGYELQNFPEAHVWARLAATAIEGGEGFEVLRARLVGNRGTVFFGEGKYQEATDALMESLVIQRKIFGPDHVDVGVTSDRVGSALLRLGKTKEAMEYHRVAVATLSKTLGETHIGLADAVNSLGNAHAEAGDLEAADQQYRRALEILKTAVGNSHARIAVAHSNLGSLALRRGNPEQAVSEFENALEVETSTKETPPSSIAQTLTSIGVAHLQRDALPDAVPPLERALTIWDAMPNAPMDAAQTKFMLARALIGTDRRRALSLATAARTALAGAGEGWFDLADEVEAWITEQRSR